MEEHLLKTLKEWYWNTKKKMIKKILIIIFINIIIISCGKKDDPVYNEENQQTRKLITHQIKFSWSIKIIDLL